MKNKIEERPIIQIYVDGIICGSFHYPYLNAIEYIEELKQKLKEMKT